MSNIYDQHEAAFARMSAYVILGSDTDDEGNPMRVATIAFKYPRDGAGRLYAYVHWLGIPMVRGYANGYGYDKHSAAAKNAIARQQWPSGSSGPGSADFQSDALHAFRSALSKDDGRYWYNHLEDAGFKVLQAV